MEDVAKKLDKMITGFERTAKKRLQAMERTAAVKDAARETSRQLKAEKELRGQ